MSDHAATPVLAGWASSALALTRNRRTGKVSGLCQALAAKAGVDPLLVRLFFVIAFIASGLGAWIYAAGWLVTSETTTGKAPLDHLIPRWRALSPRTVVVIASVIITALTLVVSLAVPPIGWSPLLIAMLTILTGQSLAYEAGTPNALTPTHPVTRSLLPTALTVVLALSAALMAYDVSDANLLFSLAIALGVIGLGLVLTASRTSPAVMVSIGVLICLIAASIIIPQESNRVVRAAPSHETIASQSSIGQRVYSGETRAVLTVNLTSVSEDVTMPIQVTSSQLLVNLPAELNVRLSGTHQSSSLTVMDEATTLNDHWAWEAISHPGEPILTLDLTADQAQIVVVRA